MGDNLMRHMVAFMAAAICLCAFYGGYVAGGHGWWWMGFGVLVVYGGVYKIVNK